MHLMNNLCMLWSLLEDVYINIGYRNGLPPETAAAALQSVWAKTGEVGKKRSAMNAKHLQFILLLPSTPLLITFKCTLNIFATAVIIQCKVLSVPGQEECTTDVH